MRLQSFSALVFSALLLPAGLFAETFNEMTVDKLDGTIMDQPLDGSKPYPLETQSTVQKGDTLTVYDQSWVILKTHKGDRIGMEGDTVMTVDEYYIEGPDRQIRLILNKGTLLLRTNGSGSRQSFFEVNSGSIVTSIDSTHAILSYDPNLEHLRVQYLEGKLTVLDKDNEQKFKDQHTEHNWENGKMAEVEALPVDELDSVNYNRFFDAEDLLEALGNNILLSDSLLGQILRGDSKGGSQIKEANDAYNHGWDMYRQGHFGAAKDLWEEALALEPTYWNARASLKKLSEEHPELKIDESAWAYESQKPKQPY